MDHDLELLLGAAALTPMSGGKITETDRFIIDDESEEILVRLSDGETRHYKVQADERAVWRGNRRFVARSAR